MFAIFLLVITRALAQPDNDTFALRGLLPAGSFTNRAYMLDATVESGENVQWNGYAPRATVWYSWKAPTNGWLRLQNKGSSATPQRVVGVFAGSNVNQLQGLGFGQTTASPAVPVNSDSNYVIGLNLLADASVPPGIELEFSGEFQAAAANDFFTSAKPILGSTATVTGTSTGSSLEPGEPTNGNPAAKNSVWFSWESPDNGTLSIAPTGQWSGRSMTVLKGRSLLSLTTIATSTGEPFSIPVSSGDAIRIVVGDQYLFGYPPPDNFSFALGFSQFTISSLQSNSKVLARTNLVLDINNLPAGATNVSLFRDSSLIGQFPGAPSSISVSNMAAGIYRFSARADLSSGIVLLSPQAEIRLSPVLDLFEDALPFNAPPSNGFLDYSEFGSGLQSGEPGNTNSLRSSLWLKTMVPGPGLLTVSIHNGDPVKAEVFLGSSLASLTAIPTAFIAGFPAKYRCDLAAAGSVYIRLGVTGTPANELSTLSLQFSERLTNDMFATPRNLGSGDTDLEFALDACTQEAGEPSGPFSLTTPTAWFRWTAPTSGLLKVQQAGLNTASGIGLFQGNSLQSLSRLTNGGPDITYPVTGGQSYLLRVHAGIDPSGGCKFVLRFEAAPSNDMFAQRSVIQSLPANLIGSLKNATIEPGESTGGTRSAWFEWTATADGFLIVESATNAFLSVLSGNSVASLQSLARLFDPASQNTQLYQFRVKAGSTYQLAVTGESFFYKGDPYFIGLAFTNSTDNDDFAGRIVLTGAAPTITNRFNGATLESGEPVHVDPSRNMKSRWWTWTAPGTGPVQVSFDNPSYPPAVAIYTGNAMASLTLVTNQPNLENNRLATARFNATQGTTYQIAGLSSTGGDLVLRVKQTLWTITKPSINSTAGGPATIQFEIGALTPDGDPLPISLAAGYYPLGGQFTALAVTSSAAATNLTISSLEPGTYQLVGRYTNASNVQFETDPVNLRIVASNDLRSTAAPAPPWGGVLKGSVGGGVFEPDTMMPGQLDGSAVWYRWRAPASGVVRIAGGSVVRLWQINGLSWTPVTPATELNISASVTEGLDYGLSVAGWTGIPPLDGFSVDFQFEGLRFIYPDTNSLSVLVGTNLQVSLQAGLADLSGVSANLILDGLVVQTAPNAPFQFTLPLNTQGILRLEGELLRNGVPMGKTLPTTLRVGPANDSTSNPTVLADTIGVLSGSTLGSRADNGNLFGNDVWFTWTAPSNGVFVLGPSTSCVARMFVTNSGGGLDSISALSGSITQAVVQATPYWIGVSRYGSPDGPFAIPFQFFTGASNDMFDSAVVLSGTNIAIAANSIAATAEPGEPQHRQFSSAQRSLWWLWEPTISGLATISATSSNYPFLGLPVGVYTGGSLASLQRQTLTSSGLNNYSFSFKAGTVYRIAVDEGRDFGSPFFWSLSVVPAPDNDLFIGRSTLVGTSITNWADARAATSESLEPSPTGRSLWWTWTAPSDGTVEWKALSPASFQFVDVFTGSTVPTLQPVASGQQSVTFQASSGTTYQLRLLGDPTTNTVALMLHPRLQNDTFAGRFQILSNGFSSQFDGLAATSEANEPTPTGRSLWWQWTASSAGIATVGITGGLSGQRVDVFGGTTLATLVRLTNGSPFVSFETKAGTNYAFRILASVGLDTFSFNHRPYATNDRFVSRITLPVRQGTVSSTTIGSSRELGEPVHRAILGGRSVWFSWTAPDHGLLTATVFGTNFNPILALYTGSAVNELQPIGNTSQISPATSTTTVTNGQVIQLAVDSSGGTEGDFSLAFNLVQLSPPISIRIQNLAPDSITFLGEGLAGGATRLESSTNLIDWTTEAFISNPGSVWSPTIPRSFSFERLFFRLKSESVSPP